MEMLNNRLLTVVIASAMAAISTSAFAGPGFRFSSKAPISTPKPKQHNGYFFGYGGLDFGSSYNTVGAFDQTDPDWVLNCPVDPLLIDPNNVPIDFSLDEGWTAGGGVGTYSELFGGSRFELEGSYTSNDASGVIYSGFALPANINMTTKAAMVNMLKEVPMGRLTGYVGAGAGYAWTTMDGDIDTILYSSTDSGFAWQLIAGVDIPITERLALFTQYRYMVLSELTHVTDFGDFRQTTTDDPASHAVVFGARVSF